MNKYFFLYLIGFTSFTEIAYSDISKDILWKTEFSDDTFKQAEKENKLILLDLEAVWCHWCHVMHNETYSKPEVQEIIAKSFIPVRIDQDSRPDLTSRYDDYGWPATIILNSKGEDLIKRAGFLDAKKFAKILEDVVRNPNPQVDKPSVEPSVSLLPGNLPLEIKSKLIANLESSFDNKKGGLDFSHRFLNSDALEYVLLNADAGNKPYEEWSKLTLKSNMKLVDPVWGGVYQYSTDSGWENAHFEKIVPTQATNLRIYSLAYTIWNDPEYLTVLNQIRSFLKTFLTSEEGDFYTSQDADVIKGQHSEEYFKLSNDERRKIGVPVVDRHVYSHENGLLAEALVAAYSATGDKQILTDVIRSVNRIVENRILSNGGFRHDANDTGGPFLRDNLAMGRTFLSLYAATGDRNWLTRARQTADFILSQFSSQDNSGLTSFSEKSAGVLKPGKLREENIPAARFFNLLFHYSADEKYKNAAKNIYSWLVRPAVYGAAKIQAGIVMVDREINSAPLHIVIVGPKNDSQAESLFGAGLRYPSTYKRIEWWDREEGRLLNHDVEYPVLQKPAAFICTGTRCSLPLFNPEGIAKLIKKTR